MAQPGALFVMPAEDGSVTEFARSIANKQKEYHQFLSLLTKNLRVCRNVTRLTAIPGRPGHAGRIGGSCRDFTCCSWTLSHPRHREPFVSGYQKAHRYFRARPACWAEVYLPGGGAGL